MEWTSPERKAREAARRAKEQEKFLKELEEDSCYNDEDYLHESDIVRFNRECDITGYIPDGFNFNILSSSECRRAGYTYDDKHVIYPFRYEGGDDW